MTTPKKKTAAPRKPAAPKATQVNEDQEDAAVSASPVELSPGQMVRTEDGQVGMVCEIGEDGPVVAFLSGGRLYQLPLDPVA